MYQQIEPQDQGRQATKYSANHMRTRRQKANENDPKLHVNRVSVGCVRNEHFETQQLAN